MLYQKRGRVISLFLCALLCMGLVPAAAASSSYTMDQAGADGKFTKLGTYTSFDRAKEAMREAADEEDDALAAASYVVRYGSRVVAMTGGIAAVRSAGNIAFSFDNYYGGRRPYVVGRSVAYYVDTDALNKVWVDVSGVRAHTNSSSLLLIPAPFMAEYAADSFRRSNPYQIDYYYRNELDNLLHVVTALDKPNSNNSYAGNQNVTTSGPWGGTITMDKAPSFMKVNVKYYSADGVTYYTDPLLKKKAGTFYPYFQHLPYHSQTDYTAAQIDNYVKNNFPSNSVLRGKGKTFKKAEKDYGINALLLLSYAIHESNRGTSAIARDKNNVFGVTAYDSTPYSSATGFTSVDVCILAHAEKYLKQGYLDALGDGRYFGANPGNKANGINVAYASDPYHGQKVGGWAYRIDKSLGSKDYGKYEIGVTTAASAPVYSDTEETETLYHMTNGKAKTAQKNNTATNLNPDLTGLPVVILARDGDYYKVQSDMPIVNGAANCRGKYSFSHVGYIRANQVKPLNTAVSPGKPGKLKVASASASSISLSWGAALSAQQYELQARAAGEESFKTIGTPGKTSFTHTGLQVGVVYEYRVRSVKKIGGDARYSGWSSVLKATPKPGKTQDLKVTPTGFRVNTVSWKAVPGASGYAVQRSLKKTKSFKTIASVKSGKKVSYADKSLNMDTRYYYRVRAYVSTDAGPLYGAYSGVKSAISKEAAPRGAKAVPLGMTSARLTWKKVSGASGYEIYRSARKKNGYKKIAALKKRSYTNTGLVSGKKYYYKIRAYKIVNGRTIYGKYAAAVSAVPQPAAVTSLTVTAGAQEGTASLGWASAADAAGYAIYRASSKNGAYQKIGTVTGRNKTAYTDSGLLEDTPYYYKVRAWAVVNGKTLNGLYSAASAYTYTSPPAPDGSNPPTPQPE